MLGPIKEWGIQDCIDVHKLLDTVFADQDAANSKFQYGIAQIVYFHLTLMFLRAMDKSSLSAAIIFWLLN